MFLKGSVVPSLLSRLTASPALLSGTFLPSSPSVRVASLAKPTRQKITGRVAAGPAEICIPENCSFVANGAVNRG